MIRAVRAAFEATGGKLRAWPEDRLDAPRAGDRPELELVRSFADEVVRAAEAIDVRDEAVDARIAEVVQGGSASAPRGEETEEGLADPSVPVPESEPFEPDPDPWRPLDDADI